LGQYASIIELLSYLEFYYYLTFNFHSKSKRVIRQHSKEKVKMNIYLMQITREMHDLMMVFEVDEVEHRAERRIINSSDANVLIYQM